MNFTEKELKILSEALQDYAIKYNQLVDNKGHITLREEPQQAIDLYTKILNG